MAKWKTPTHAELEIWRLQLDLQVQRGRTKAAESAHASMRSALSSLAQERRSVAMSLEQFGDALGMDWRVFKSRAEAEWALRQQGRKYTLDFSRMSPSEAERVERHSALRVERRANRRLVRRSRQ